MKIGYTILKQTTLWGVSNMNGKKLQDALTELFKDEQDVVLAKSIVGIADPAQIADFVDRFCIEYLSNHVSECHFVVQSIGSSFGLRLDNGLDIYMKINKLHSEISTLSSFTLKALRAVSNVQDKLFHKGFPCPAIIRHPVEYQGTLVTISEYANIGTQLNAHHPSVRREMAEKLAELLQLADPYKGMDGFYMNDLHNSKSLYPPPHNALFDLAIGEKDAGWIDELAYKSKKIITSIESNIVLGHSDWSMKNMRFIDEKIVMIYDWDSLYLQDECHFIGNAASTFPTTWDIPVKITPSQEEAISFVREYELARGKKLSSMEWAKTSAYATFILCYIARCELSINPNNENYEGSCRQALQEMESDSYLYNKRR